MTGRNDENFAGGKIERRGFRRARGGERLKQGERQNFKQKQMPFRAHKTNQF
jgi:hypothetical protein